MGARERLVVGLIIGIGMAFGAVGCGDSGGGTCDEAPVCPGDTIEVERCPPGSTCSQVEACDTRITCLYVDAGSDAGSGDVDGEGGFDGEDSAGSEGSDGESVDGEGDVEAEGPTHYGGEHPDREGDGWERPTEMVWTEIGGGSDYARKICDPPAGAARANSKSGLLSALESAGDGDVVWVPGSATIDLTGEYEIEISEGVTLASDRGCGGSEGAKLVHTSGSRTEAMFTLRQDARITGFEIRGYAYDQRDPSFTPAPRSATLAYGLHIRGDRGEVDNNHVTSFVGKCIVASNGAKNIWVHHNRIDWCHRLGYGYGLSFGSDVEGLAEFNRFDNFRHAIVGVGTADCMYEARYNVAGPYRQNHTFDMHGAGGVGGKRMLIHHNTFLGKWTYHAGGNCVQAQPYVDVRATPDEPVQVHDNWMVDQDQQWVIEVVDDEYDASNNQIGTSEPDCGVGAPRRGCSEFAPPGPPPENAEYDGYRSFGSYNVEQGDDGDPCLEPPL